jgi:hypothetical protein
MPAQVSSGRGRGGSQYRPGATAQRVELRRAVRAAARQLAGTHFDVPYGFDGAVPAASPDGAGRTLIVGSTLTVVPDWPAGAFDAAGATA